MALKKVAAPSIALALDNESRQQMVSTQFSSSSKIDVLSDDTPPEGCQVFLNFCYWTNWLHVLMYYGFKSIFCVHNEMGISPILRESYQVQCFSLPFMFNKLSSNNKISTLVLVEGPPEFIENLVNALNAIKVFAQKELNCHFIMIPTKRIRSFSFSKHLRWDHIHHHADAGGATTTSFQVAYHPKHLCSRAPPALHKWKLADFLKSTVKGIVTDPPTKSISLLTVDEVTSFHTTPCVFSRTGWVQRRLSASEILRCLDVPQQLDRLILNHHGTSTQSFAWCAILSSASGKILLFILHSLQPFRQSNVSSESLYPAPSAQVADTNFKSLLRGNFVLDSDSPADRNIKASKSDNAEVPVGLWNDKAVGGNCSFE